MGRKSIIDSFKESTNKETVIKHVLTNENPIIYIQNIMSCSYAPAKKLVEYIKKHNSVNNQEVDIEKLNLKVKSISNFSKFLNIKTVLNKYTIHGLKEIFRTIYSAQCELFGYDLIDDKDNLIVAIAYHYQSIHYEDIFGIEEPAQVKNLSKERIEECFAINNN